MSEYTYSSSSADSSGDATPMEWRDYLAILLERIWILIAALVLCSFASVIHLKRQIPIYSSYARISIEDSPRTLLSLQDVLYMNRNSEEIFNTHIKTLTSRSLMRNVLKSPKLKGREPVLNWELDEALQIDVGLGMLSVQQVPKSRLIDISVYHPHADIAADVANVVAHEYIQMDAEKRVGKSVEVVGWLQKQAEEYRGKLEEGMLEIQKYREDQRAVSLDERQDVVVSKLQALSGSVTRAEDEARAMEANWVQINDAQGNPQELVKLSVIADNPQVAAIRGVLEAKRNEKNVLSVSYRARHPRMIQLDHEINLASNTFSRICIEATDQYRAAFKAASVHLESLTIALQAQEKEAFELDKLLVPYQQLQRSVDADKQIYEAMLGRMKEAHVAGDMEINTIRMIDEARISRNPVSPNPKRIITMGVLLGGVLGVSFIFMLHLMDTRVRRIDDLERTVGLPILASIPRIKSNERARIVETQPNSSPAEAFRTLRATIALQPHGRDAKLLLVTSVSSGDGKSLISSNLACVYAHDNQRTLLIDTDMRRPTVHRTYGLGRGKDTEGLSQVLQGKATWRDVIKPSEVKGLDVMSSGAIPNNPAELLGSTSFTQLLVELREEYDRIILDSPPVMGVSDPLVMLSQVDGIIFVVHFGETKKHGVSICIQQLRSSNKPILGLVLDDVVVGRMGSYYYYHRYGGYNYHQHEKVDSESDPA